MKVILISVIPNLGRVGDVVEVRNGYAKNFLIPSKKAICFTDNNYKVFESKRAEFEQENQKNLESSSTVKDKISGKNVIITENASDDGRLYGSVTSARIAAKINEIIKSKFVVRSNIFLKKPIKEIGIYQVSVSLHSEVSFDVCVIVSRSESEAEVMLRDSSKKNRKVQDSEEKSE